MGEEKNNHLTFDQLTFDCSSDELSQNNTISNHDIDIFAEYMENIVQTHEGSFLEEGNWLNNLTENLNFNPDDFISFTPPAHSVPNEHYVEELTAYPLVETGDVPGFLYNVYDEIEHTIQNVNTGINSFGENYSVSQKELHSIFKTIRESLVELQNTSESVIPLHETLDVIGNSALYSTTRVLIKYKDPAIIRKAADSMYCILRQSIEEKSNYYNTEVYDSVFHVADFPLTREAMVKIVEFFPPNYSSKAFYGEYFHYDRLINDGMGLNYNQFLEATRHLNYLTDQPHFYNYNLPPLPVLEVLSSSSLL